MLEHIPHGKASSTFVTAAVTRQQLSQTVAMVVKKKKRKRKKKGRERENKAKEVAKKRGSGKLNDRAFSLWVSQWAAYNVC